MKKSKKNIREEILRVLSTPSTVTEIKNKIPEITSFGTLSYHLKNLENERIITKTKDKKKQGQPTRYKLESPEVIERLEKFRNIVIQNKVSVLRLIEKDEFIEDSIMLKTLERQGGDSEFIGDMSMECVNENLATLHFKITPKGKQFLKNHSKK